MMRKGKLLSYGDFLDKYPDWVLFQADLYYREESAEATEQARIRARMSTGHVLRFFQDNGLTRRVICPTAPDIPHDLHVYLRDVTSEGLQLYRTGYQKWLGWLDRSPIADPSNVRLLEKELAKIRASAGEAEQAKPTERKKKTTRRFLSGKRVAKDFVSAPESVEFVKYDDASWHYEGDFPNDLPNEAGATHTGMFVAWAVLSGLASEDHIKAFTGELSQLKLRNISPGAYFIRTCDGKFSSEELSREGNAFAHAYFDLQTGKYLQDYEELLAAGLPSTYHVSDTWDSFDKLKPILDQRLSEWVCNGKQETL